MSWEHLTHVVSYWQTLVLRVNLCVAQAYCKISTFITIITNTRHLLLIDTVFCDKLRICTNYDTATLKNIIKLTQKQPSYCMELKIGLIIVSMCEFISNVCLKLGLIRENNIHIFVFLNNHKMFVFFPKMKKICFIGLSHTTCIVSEKD